MLQARVHFGFSETLLVGKHPSPHHTHTHKTQETGELSSLRVWP